MNEDTRRFGNRKAIRRRRSQERCRIQHQVTHRTLRRFTWILSSYQKFRQ
jgi:hypothetical protein